MTTDREHAIAELVEAQRHYNRYPNTSSRITVMRAARALADIEDPPPLPDEVEVQMTWCEEEIDGTHWVAAYGLNRETTDTTYRVRITPLERVR